MLDGVVLEFGGLQRCAECECQTHQQRLITEAARPLLHILLIVTELHFVFSLSCKSTQLEVTDG